MIPQTHDPNDTPHRSDRLPATLAVLVLLLMGVLAGGAARRESVTIDEVPYVGAGVSYFQKLDMRMDPEHPPLAKLLAALPLVLRGVRADYESLQWTSADGLFAAYVAQWSFGHALATRWNEPVATMAWARFPMLLLTLTLGAMLYVYGSRLANAWGGLLCVCLYASMPVFLAFGPLVLTDVAIVFWSLLTIWTFADLWRSGGERGVTARFALALAGALLSKSSAGILFLAFVVFSLSTRWWPVQGAPTGSDEARAWRRRGWRSTWRGVLWAALVVYAVYFVLTWNQPTDSLAVLGSHPVSLAVRRLLMPPWIFLRGVALCALMSNRTAFILGHTYPHGVWFYFPVLFLLKTPLAALPLLLFGTPAAAVARRLARVSVTPPGRELHSRAVWTLLLATTAVYVLGRSNIGIRHFMTPIALLILLVSPLPAVLASLARSGWRVARPLGWAVATLALLSLVTAARAYPH